MSHRLPETPAGGQTCSDWIYLITSLGQVFSSLVSNNSVNFVVNRVEHSN